MKNPKAASDVLSVTYIGGPTALLELGGLRLLTDPTFDPAGSEYGSGDYVLRKTQGPALLPDALGGIDAVLLSHDHHFDNFDRSGREFASRVPLLLTTLVGAERIGGNAAGMTAWDVRELSAADDRRLRVTATPARHGPPGGDRGPVVGFLLECVDHPESTIYITGDTVWFDGVAEVLDRSPVSVVLPFAGAARVKVAGPSHLTLTAAECIQIAQACPHAPIVPLHFEGWEHFSEGPQQLKAAFAAGGMSERLQWPGASRPLAIALG